MKLPKIFRVFLFIFICEVVGILGSYFTISSIPTWYATLNKPIFNPPNWLFGPVWTILYALMGISIFLILEKVKKKNEARKGIKLFVIQLILNGIWTPIFFGFRELFFAFVIIIVLLFLILMTMSEFYKIDKTASYLLIPYFLWVSFATILNFSLWILN